MSEIYPVMIRIVNDKSWSIQHRLLHLELFDGTLDASGMALYLERAFRNLGIGANQVSQLMRDGAASNACTFQVLTQFDPAGWRNTMNGCCIPHTLDLVEKTVFPPDYKEFISAPNAIFGNVQQSSCAMEKTLSANSNANVQRDSLVELLRGEHSCSAADCDHGIRLQSMECELR